MKTVGAPFALFWTTGFTFAELTNDSFLLLFHLSYYSIAFHIQLIGIKLTNYICKNQSDLYWKGIKNVLLQLNRVSIIFQSIFAFPVLFIITTKFTFASFDSFEVIFSLLKPNYLLSVSWILRNLIIIPRYLLSILIVLHAADLPVQQVFIWKSFQ